MSDIHKSTRIGDLLIERGVITRRQALLAIDLQQKRRFEELESGSPKPAAKELGEILIELGFINRQQLNSGLSWQKKIRKTTLAMAFFAPLLIAACGGSAKDTGQKTNATSGSPTATQEVGNTSSASSLPASNGAVKTPNKTDQDTSEGASSSSSHVTNTPIQVVGVASSSASSAGNSSPAAASLSSAPASSSASSEAHPVDGAVAIYWTIPTYRENGDDLDIREIGGYELRYKMDNEEEYTVVKINDAYADTYYFDNLTGDYKFEIATFDVKGLYSDFVPIKPI